MTEAGPTDAVTAVSSLWRLASCSILVKLLGSCTRAEPWVSV